MTDKIRSADTKVDIDFYSLDPKTDTQTVDLHLDSLKNGAIADSTQPPKNTESMTYAQFKTSWLIWLLFFAAISFVLFNGYALGMTVMDAYAHSPVLAVLMALTSIGFIGLLGYGISKEVFGFLSLKQLKTSVDLEALSAHNNLKWTLKSLKQRAASQQKSELANSLNQRFFASIQPHHSNADVIDIYISNIEEPLLRKAKEILKQEALRSGGIAFISPNEFIQSLSLIWTNLRVLRLISQLYGIRPGVVGNLKLLGLMWQNVIMQNATDVLAEQLAKDVTHKFLGTLAEKAGVAATSGGLTVRLGLQLIKHLSLVKNISKV